MPDLTLVSAFFRIPEDRGRDYLGLFDDLARVGLPFVVFFDETFPAGLAPVSRHPNVTVVPTRLEDSWTHRTLARWPDLALPRVRTPSKDSRSFLSLTNAKLDYLESARALTSSSHLAWIDFGVLHVVPGPARAAFLAALRAAPLPQPGLLVPGCWDRPTNLEALWEAVCWRFCGALLLGDRESLAGLYERYQETFAEEVARREALTWEVNIWALLEARGQRFDWYKADHDETLVPSRDQSLRSDSPPHAPVPGEMPGSASR